MKKKIAIIGSGIAGLTLASLLKEYLDFEFVVYEKKEKLNLDEGFGVQLSVNSVSILNTIGFEQLNKNDKYQPSKLDFYSEKFKKVCDLDLTSFNTTNKKYTTLKRSVLIKFLKEKLLTNSLIFNKKINKIKKVNKKIDIYFEDGSSEIVDYLVVADGIFTSTKSVIENKLFKPVDYKATAIRAQIKSENIPSFNSNNISLVMGSNFHLVMYPVNQSDEFNLICIVRKKLEDIKSIKNILEKTIFKEKIFLSHLFEKNLKSWPIYISNKPTRSIHGNVFYIGDAFYTFPPTMAQGASQAIESANEIFNLIKDNNTNIQNIYFKNRKDRINLINKRSVFNYFVFHISNSLLKFLRNLIMKRLVKNKNFINSYLGKIYK